MPHGPLHAVNVGVVTIIHGAPGAGSGGVVILTSCGWPASAMLMSGSGPFGPIFFGVWQSWQPAIVTRYLPRSSVLCDAAGIAGAACCALSAAVARMTAVVAKR